MHQLSEKFFPVGIQNSVAAFYSCLFGWAAFNGTDYGNGIFINVKTYPNSRESPAHIIGIVFILTFRNINGMWIEVLKNSVYGNVNNAVGIHIVHIFIIYIINKPIELVFF